MSKDIEHLPEHTEPEDDFSPEAEKTGWESFQHGARGIVGMMKGELGAAPVTPRAKELMIAEMHQRFTVPLDGYAGKPGMLAEVEAVWKDVRDSAETDPAVIAERAGTAFHRLLSTRYEFEEYCKAIYGDKARDLHRRFVEPEERRHEEVVAALKVVEWNAGTPGRSAARKATAMLGESGEALLREMEDFRYARQVFEKLTDLGSHTTDGWRLLRFHREGANAPLRDAARPLLAAALPAMERYVRYQPRDLGVYRRGLAVLYQNGTDAERRAALESRERMRDIAPQADAEDDIVQVAKGETAKREAAIGAIRTGIWGDDAQRSRSIAAICEMLYAKERRLADLGKTILGQALADRGLDAPALFSAWDSATQSQSMDSRDWSLSGTYAINISAIAKLEKEHKGAPAYLQRTYGICMFMRYPLELLKRQYELRDEKDKPHAVVVFPHGDWNGAFTPNTPTNQFEMLQKQLGDKFVLRVSESGSRYGFMRSLARFHRDHGKIAFAVIGGHGNPDSVQFGDNNDRSNRSMVRRRDLKYPGMTRMGEFFEPGATILLEACSTGQKKGIAQRLAETWGDVTVIGPDIPSAVNSVTLDASGDVPVVTEVRYFSGAKPGRFRGQQRKAA